MSAEFRLGQRNQSPRQAVAVSGFYRFNGRETTEIIPDPDLTGVFSNAKGAAHAIEKGAETPIPFERAREVVEVALLHGGTHTFQREIEPDVYYAVEVTAFPHSSPQGSELPFSGTVILAESGEPLAHVQETPAAFQQRILRQRNPQHAEKLDHRTFSSQAPLQNARRREKRNGSKR